jgi:hypothetical protein
MTEGVFDFFSKKKEKGMTNGQTIIHPDGTITLADHVEILDFNPSDAS